MLPKPEKNKKKLLDNPIQEQLPLVESENKEEKIKKKRLIVGLSLALTVVLSISFSIYRYVKSTTFTLPKANITAFQNSKKTTDLLSKDISILLQREKNMWAVVVQDSNNQNIFNWSNNSDFSIPSELITDSLKKINTSSDSGVLNNILPGGVDVKDSILIQNGDILYVSTLSVPSKKFNIFIKVSNGSLLDKQYLNQKISILVEKIYWFFIDF